MARRAGFTLDNETCRLTKFDMPKTGANRSELNFRVHPRFTGYGDTDFEITVVARRAKADNNAGMTFNCESIKGGYPKLDEWWTIPPGEKWHQHTFRVKNANFCGQWGHNFNINAVSSPGDFYLKEVSVRNLDELAIRTACKTGRSAIPMALRRRTISAAQRS